MSQTHMLKATKKVKLTLALCFSDPFVPKQQLVENQMPHAFPNHPRARRTCFSSKIKSKVRVYLLHKQFVTLRRVSDCWLVVVAIVIVEEVMTTLPHRRLSPRGT